SDNGPVLPASSAARACSSWVPSSSGTDTFTVHSPEPSAMVDPKSSESITNVTSAPASAVPLTVGVVLFVTAPSVGTRITGAAGATVSTVNVTGVDGSDVR